MCFQPFNIGAFNLRLCSFAHKTIVEMIWPKLMFGLYCSIVWLRATGMSVIVLWHFLKPPTVALVCIFLFFPFC